MPERSVVSRIRSFNRFYTAFLGVLDRHFLKSPYSLTEVRVLYEIRHSTECLARDIGASLGMDRGYLSRIIYSFITGGLARSSPSRQDRRRRVITLTKKGKKMSARLEAKSDQLVSLAVKALSAAQQEELARHMERIQDLLMRSE